MLDILMYAAMGPQFDMQEGNGSLNNETTVACFGRHMQRTPLTGHGPLCVLLSTIFSRHLGRQVEDGLAKGRALYNRTLRTDGRMHKHRLMRETSINTVINTNE